MDRFNLAGFCILLCMGRFAHSSPVKSQPALMPESCENNVRGKEFCTVKHSDYPEDTINKLLHKMVGFWQEVVNKTVVDRAGNDFDNPCEVYTENNPIYEIIDEHDDVRYVVQDNKMFNQIIEMELCKNPGLIRQPRALLNSLSLQDNNFECRQKSLDYKFLVLSHDRTKLELARMKNDVPVCCSCVKV